MTIPGGYRKVNFVYDHRGRRVEKRVYKRDSSDNTQWGTYPIERRRFVWNGWLMLRETIDTDANADGDLADTGDSTRVKCYTWGRDLGAASASCGAGVSPASCLESAGGIGGLLSVYDDNATTTGENPTADDLKYVYLYDANGNVGQLCNLSANDVSSSIVAKYEYDAYGTPTVSSGMYAVSNTYRFSTRPWDDETGLGYWGYRYYDPRLGRWMSRDPIQESGGTILYGFVRNTPQLRVDADGRKSIIGGGEPDRPWPKGPPAPPITGSPGHYLLGCDWATDCVWNSWCRDYCASDPYHLGLTTCSPAWCDMTCICNGNITARYGTASGMVESCVRQHEKRHRIDDCEDGECNALTAEGDCLRSFLGAIQLGIQACDCACMRSLANIITENITGCVLDCPQGQDSVDTCKKSNCGVLSDLYYVMQSRGCVPDSWMNTVLNARCPPAPNSSE